MLSIIVSEYLRHIGSRSFVLSIVTLVHLIILISKKKKKNASQWLSLITRPRVNQCRKGVVEFDGINSDDWFN